MGQAQYTLPRIIRRPGIAGQVAYDVDAIGCTEDGYTWRHWITFVGSPEFGGPVIMIDESGRQTFVSRDVNVRCGKFGTDWVYRFFGLDPDTKMPISA